MSRPAPRLDVMPAGKRAWRGVAIGVAVALLLAAVRPSGALEMPEQALLDVRTRAFVGTRPPDPRIVLAVIDDVAIQRMAASPAAYETWPWPQDIQANLVHALRHAGARGLMLDFLYFDRGKDPALFPAHDATDRQTYFDEAQVLGAALDAYGPVVMGFEVATDPVWEHPARVEVAASRWLDLGPAAGRPSRLPREGVDLPVRVLLKGARWLGHTHVKLEADGVVRSMDPLAVWKERTLPALSLAAASLLEPDVAVTPEGVRVGTSHQALDDQGTFLLNFRGPGYETYPAVSAVDLVWAGYRLENGEDLPDHEQAALDAVKDKLVIWGASFAGDLDAKPTALHPTFLGPEIHAVALDNLLHGDGRIRAGRLANTLWLLVLLVALGAALLAAQGRWRPLLATALALGLIVAVGWGAFRVWGLALDVATPGLGVLLVTLGATAYRLLTEGRRNKWLESTFSRYLAPDVIEALKQDPSRLSLGGRRRDLTIFFSDVAGFTSISEQLKPEEVVRLLNRYLTGQSDVVMQEQGVIDKFEGDAIMSFYGDPLDMEDHALRGCRAALRCQAALPALEPLWRELGLDGFAVRIGLNSGPALVGNMGSDKRFDYTCMGDAVNLASRLEGANKAFGSQILIGPETRRGAGDAILAKHLADLVVVGKTEAVDVHELVALRDEASPAQRDHVASWEAFRASLAQDDLDAARGHLAEAEAAWPEQATLAWARSLVDALESGGLPRPWDGRWILDRK